MEGKRTPITASPLSYSPVEHTLEILNERLSSAEEETQKLMKHLSQYGFQK